MEVRGDVCVLHCGGVGGQQLAGALPDELRRCREAGARAVVVDLDPWVSPGEAGLRALGREARAFRRDGGEIVVAVEEPEARRALAEAGLMRAVPARPGPAEGQGAPDAGAGPRWEHEFTFPATAERLSGARRRVTAYAEVAGLRDDGLFELSVAVAEALANAVIHGSPRGGDDDVRVRFFCYPDEVAVEVVDAGGGLAASPLCVPAASATNGRGIHFMRALTDDVHYTCGPLGTHVLLVKRRS